MKKRTRRHKYYTIRKKNFKAGANTDSPAKTIKQKRKYKLKIVEVFGDNKKDITTPQETVKVENKMGERWNEKFIDVLEKLNDSEPYAFIVPVDPEQTYFPKITSTVLPDGKMQSNPLHLMTPELSTDLASKVFKYL